MKKVLPRGTTLPGWVWPLALLVVTLVLVAYGRALVAGLFAVVAMAFLLAVVTVLMWALVAMAIPGSRGALHEMPHSWREVRPSLKAAWRQMIQLAGRAPWRSSPRIVTLVAHQLEDAVFDLPSGPVAYSHLRVRLNARTVQQLDQWMPIEQVAAIWAQHYVDTHREMRGSEPSVTVSVCSSEELPRGRAAVDGAFRAAPQTPGTWAKATRLRVGHEGAMPLDVQNIVRLGANDLNDPQVPACALETWDLTTRLDPDATVRRPAAGTRPPARAAAGGEPPGSASSAQTRTLTKSAFPPPLDIEVAATQRSADATEPLPAADCGQATVDAGPEVGATESIEPIARLALRLQRLDPVTHRTLEVPPVLLHALRVGIGRDLGMDVVVEDPYVSREHAELRRFDDHWTICDSQSTHGTAVNGVRLTSNERLTIQDGDILTFGRNPAGGPPTFRVLLGMPASHRRAS